jgi:hypothetical protein
MPRSLAVLALLAVGSSAAAQITQTGSGQVATNANTLTFNWTHTGGGGSNGVVVVAVASEAPQANSAAAGVASVTYAGQAMTRLDASLATITNSNNTGSTVLYYLPTAVAGGQVVVTSVGSGTWAGTGRVGTSVSLDGVNAAVAPVAASATATNTDTISVALANLAANSWVVDAASHGNAGGTFTPGPAGPNRVEVADLSNTSGGLASALATFQDVSGTVNPSWLYTQIGTRMTMSAAAFTPVPEPLFGLGLAAAGLLAWRRRAG